MFKFIIIKILLLSLIGNILFAKQDYCSIKNTKTFDISIFGESYFNKDDQRNMVRGIAPVLEQIQMGDKLKMTVFNGSEALTILDECYPGCPDKGLLDSLINTDCSDTIARQDKTLIKKKFTAIIKKELVKGNSLNQYDILDHLRGLDNNYRNKDLNETKIMVFHSLLPYGANGIDVKAFDKAFVKVIQQGGMKDLSIPDNVTFINSNNSKLTDQFWEDLKLNNTDEGLKIKFNKEIIE